MRTITVTGTGSSSVAPDTAMVRVAAVARGARVAEAYDAMVQAAASVVAVAGRHTEARRVASTGITVWPTRDHEGRESGYEARHSFAIACAELVGAGAMLADLADEVGDHLAVDSVGLEVVDDHGAGDKAREAAFHDARDRAAQLARMAGAGLGEVQSIVEGDAADGPSPVVKAAMLRDAGLQPGEATVSTTLTVVWELLA
ncbi:hypothetical protein ASG76_17925 [Nocardioides sp. Soil774]|uniref:SIMPL domain-containing protein n=1 Tax=Nocardioides sp. Soil774 TaxID=1736408 RepID=UPI0006FA0250|nr:SIMPL domain-containing protein [Nocardioides sp. Soil774]KRE92321.1 hypothetical protein ASG76_17925 [Nocardioides sp. Soil774]